MVPEEYETPYSLGGPWHDAYLSIAAGIRVPSLDCGYSLAHRAVLRHTDGGVRGEVEAWAIIILIQNGDVDLGADTLSHFLPLSPRYPYTRRSAGASGKPSMFESVCVCVCVL